MCQCCFLSRWCYGQNRETWRWKWFSKTHSFTTLCINRFIQMVNIWHKYKQCTLDVISRNHILNGVLEDLWCATWSIIFFIMVPACLVLLKKLNFKTLCLGVSVWETLNNAPFPCRIDNYTSHCLPVPAAFISAPVKSAFFAASHLAVLSTGKLPLLTCDWLCCLI